MQVAQSLNKVWALECKVRFFRRTRDANETISKLRMCRLKNYVKQRKFCVQRMKIGLILRACPTSVGMQMSEWKSAVWIECGSQIGGKQALRLLLIELSTSANQIAYNVWIYYIVLLRLSAKISSREIMCSVSARFLHVSVELTHQLTSQECSDLIADCTKHRFIPEYRVVYFYSSDVYLESWLF